MKETLIPQPLFHQFFIRIRVFQLPGKPPGSLKKSFVIRFRRVHQTFGAEQFPDQDHRYKGKLHLSPGILIVDCSGKISKEKIDHQLLCDHIREYLLENRSARRRIGRNAFRVFLHGKAKDGFSLLAVRRPVRAQDLQLIQDVEQVLQCTLCGILCKLHARELSVEPFPDGGGFVAGQKSIGLKKGTAGNMDLQVVSQGQNNGKPQLHRTGPVLEDPEA